MTAPSPAWWTRTSPAPRTWCTPWRWRTWPRRRNCSGRDPDLPDTYYLGRLAAPGTIDTIPEKTLLAFADHGRLDQRLDPDYAAAERIIAAVAEAGVDAGILAERLQREGAGRFSADWAALLSAIKEKTGKPGTGSNP